MGGGDLFTGSTMLTTRTVWNSLFFFVSGANITSHLEMEIRCNKTLTR